MRARLRLHDVCHGHRPLQLQAGREAQDVPRSASSGSTRAAFEHCNRIVWIQHDDRRHCPRSFLKSNQIKPGIISHCATCAPLLYLMHIKSPVCLFIFINKPHTPTPNPRWQIPKKNVSYSEIAGRIRCGCNSQLGITLGPYLENVNDNVMESAASCVCQNSLHTTVADINS